MNKQENRYVELVEEAVFGGMLDKKKQQELNKLEHDLDVEDCKVCEGNGFRYSKGFDGSGDEGECFICDGTGKVGLREEVKIKIKEVMNI